MVPVVPLPPIRACWRLPGLYETAGSGPRSRPAPVPPRASRAPLGACGERRARGRPWRGRNPGLPPPLPGRGGRVLRNRAPGQGRSDRAV